MIKSINDKRTETSPNQLITYYSKSLIHNGEIITAFAKQFTSPISHSSNPFTRIVKRKLLKECLST